MCSTTLVAAADRDRMLANVGLAWTSNDEASPDFRTIEDSKKQWGKIRTATKIAFALQPMPEAPHTSNLPKDELEARFHGWAKVGPKDELEVRSLLVRKHDFHQHHFSSSRQARIPSSWLVTLTLGQFILG